MTTLSGRPDLVEVVSRVHHSASSSPVVVVAKYDKTTSETEPQLTPETTASLRVTPSNLEDIELSTFTHLVTSVSVYTLKTRSSST